MTTATPLRIAGSGTPSATGSLCALTSPPTTPQTAPTALPARAASGGAPRPVLMKLGHQHDHSETTLRALAAFGVNHICSGKVIRELLA